MEIRIDNLTKVIKGSTVINNVTLKLNSGVITGLKGINGSGKTMLMRLIAGLIRPTSGKISIGDDCLWKDISFPESIGMLIENPAFLDNFSGYENLKLLVSINNRVTDQEIRNTLSRIDLTEAADKKYEFYSLGMKQRLGIAAAIVERPKIILLDEPTNALDTSGVDLVKQILMEEKRRGALIVLACHDYQILREFSDIIYFIEEGKITGMEEQDRGI